MINGKVLNVLTKTVGATGLGLVLYDAHTAGKLHGSMHEKNSKASSLTHHAQEDLMLDSPSIVQAKLKEKVFHYHLDENFMGFFHTIGGYMSGATSMMVNQVVPFALSIGTLATKGIASKLFGAGLLAYGGIYIAQHVFGIGKGE